MDRIVFVNENILAPREDGRVPVRIATEHVDRTNDVVVVRGGRFDNYRRNPSVLYEHIGNTSKVDGQASFPIARCVKLWVENTPEGDELLGLDELDEAEENPVGQLVGSMVRRGMINGISIALIPLEPPEEIPVTRDMVVEGKAYPFVRQGERQPTIRIYRDWEKLEHSFVIIPVNGRAVVMKSMSDAGTATYLFRELEHLIAKHASGAVLKEVQQLGRDALCGSLDEARWTEVAANELIDAAIQRVSSQ